MLKKIKQWWKLRKPVTTYESFPETYDKEQMEQAYKLGYNDGRRDGLSIAREQATKSLRRILWEQNANQQSKK